MSYKYFINMFLHTNIIQMFSILRSLKSGWMPKWMLRWTGCSTPMFGARILRLQGSASDVLWPTSINVKHIIYYISQNFFISSIHCLSDTSNFSPKRLKQHSEHLLISTSTPICLPGWRSVCSNMDSLFLFRGNYMVKLLQLILLF